MADRRSADTKAKSGSGSQVKGGGSNYGSSYQSTGNARVDAQQASQQQSQSKNTLKQLRVERHQQETSSRHLQQQIADARKYRQPINYSVQFQEDLRMQDKLTGYTQPSQPSQPPSSDSASVDDTIIAKVIKGRKSDEQIAKEVAKDEKKGRDLKVTFAEELGLRTSETPAKTPSQMGQVGGVPSFMSGGSYITEKTGKSAIELLLGIKSQPSQQKPQGKNYSVEFEETLGFGQDKPMPNEEWFPKYFETGTVQQQRPQPSGQDYFDLDEPAQPSKQKDTFYPWMAGEQREKPKGDRGLAGIMAVGENAYSLGKDVIEYGQESIDQGKIVTDYEPIRLKKDIIITPTEILSSAIAESKTPQEFVERTSKDFSKLGKDIQQDWKYYQGNIGANAEVALASFGIEPALRTLGAVKLKSAPRAKGIAEFLFPAKQEKIEVWELTGKGAKSKSGVDILEYQKGTKTVPETELVVEQKVRRTQDPDIVAGQPTLKTEPTGNVRTQIKSPIETFEKAGSRYGFDVYKLTFGDEGRFKGATITMTPDPIIELYEPAKPLPQIKSASQRVLRLEPETAKELKTKIAGKSPQDVQKIFEEFAQRGTGGEYKTTSAPRDYYLGDVETGKIYKVPQYVAETLGARGKEIYQSQQFTLSELYGTMRETKNPQIVNLFREGKVKSLGAKPFQYTRYSLDLRTFLPEDLGKPFTLGLDETKTQVKKGKDIKTTKDVSREIFDTEFGKFDFEKISGFEAKALKFKPDMFGKSSVEDLSARGGNILDARLPKQDYYETSMLDLVDTSLEKYTKKTEQEYARRLNEEYGVTDPRSFNKIWETKEWIDREASLNIQNTFGNDFEYISGDMLGGLEANRKSVLESALYWNEKDFGFDTPEPSARPKNRAEELGEALYEPFRKMKDEELAQIPSRQEDFMSGKKFLDDYSKEVYGKIFESYNKELTNIEAYTKAWEESKAPYRNLPKQKGSTLKVTLENLPEQPITFEQDRLQIGYPDTTISDTSLMGQTITEQKPYILGTFERLSKKEQDDIFKEMIGIGFEADKPMKLKGGVIPSGNEKTSPYGFELIEPSQVIPDTDEETGFDLDLWSPPKEKKKDKGGIIPTVIPKQIISPFSSQDEIEKLGFNFDDILDVSIETKQTPRQTPVQDESFRFQDDLALELGTIPEQPFPDVPPETFPTTELPPFDFPFGFGGALGSWDDSFGKGGKSPRFWNADPENVLGFFKSDLGYQGKEFKQLTNPKKRKKNKDWSGYDTIGDLSDIGF